MAKVIGIDLGTTKDIKWAMDCYLPVSVLSSGPVYRSQVEDNRKVSILTAKYLCSAIRVSISAYENR